MRLPPNVRRATIDAVVCERLGETKHDGNFQPWCFHRQIAMHLMVKTGYSLAAVGNFYDKHHTTVLHSHEKIQALRKSNPEWDAAIAEIEKDIAEGAPPRTILLPKQVRREDHLRSAIREEFAALLAGMVAGGGAA